MNKGGSQQVAGLTMTMTDARHSSGFMDNGQMIYMGEPAGFVIRLEDGRTIYFAGDTSLFGDMRLIGDRYRRRSRSCRSAIASRWIRRPRRERLQILGVRQVVPMHWGTFPMLTGTPAELKRLVEPGNSGIGVEAGRDGGIGPGGRRPPSTIPLPRGGLA